MIHSSGQIITGRAAKVIQDGIGVKPDTEGWYRTAYKALVLADSPDGSDSNVYGPWVKEAAAGEDDKFVGIIGDDDAPYANVNLDTNNPVLGYGESKSFAVGDVMTIERNGILSVIAGADITQGDYLKLANNGAFQKGSRDKGIGFAMESAKAGERFRATIYSI